MDSLAPQWVLTTMIYLFCGAARRAGGPVGSLGRGFDDKIYGL